MRVALVVGGAGRVAEDLRVTNSLFHPDRVYAVNDIGAHLETLDTWCTLHPEFMDGWEEERRLRGLLRCLDVVAPPPSEVGMHGEKGRIARRVTYKWPDMRSSASSGIYGAKVALDDGFDRVVLAGVPLTKEDGHFLPGAKTGYNVTRGKVWDQQRAFVAGYREALPRMIGRVRSVSGYTMETLGFPDEVWLGLDRVEGSNKIEKVEQQTEKVT